jgi:hypothetical protein
VDILENILASVGNYGFPMVVSIYLLIRIEKKLESLTDAINGLKYTLGQSNFTAQAKASSFQQLIPVEEGKSS